MSRPAFARIDLDALRNNYQLARSRHGGRALAVIKADAYGHGSVRCARALSDIADGFAVAVLEEALVLRAGGITRPILVLEGAFGPDDIERAAEHDLWLVVHQREQIDLMERVPPRRALTIWLKMDSGMHRAGVAPEYMATAHARLSALPTVDAIVLMTHMARADEPDVPTTLAQVEAFERTTADLPGERSMSNSACILGWPATWRDWARPGIMLYGADPMPEDSRLLKPVMTLGSAIMNVRSLAPGDVLGYGGRFVAERPTRVGLVAMGYADGYPRTAADGTPVAVDGQLTRLIGRVSMDMLTVDLTELPDAGLGSKVELWGAKISANTIAQAAGTIAYELFCNVKRVRRTYTGVTGD